MPPEATPPTPAAGPYWTDRRRDLQRALTELSPIAGGLYTQAIQQLEQTPRTLVHIVMSAHALRELVNGLPDLLGIEAMPAWSDVQQPAQALAAAWEADSALPNAADVLPTERASESQPQTTIAVSAETLEAARLVVLASQRGSTNNRLRLSAVVLGRLESARDPSVELFRRSLGFFVRLSHAGRAQREPEPNDSDLTYHLEVIEQSLHARVGAFFGVVEELLDLVEEANRQGGDAA